MAIGALRSRTRSVNEFIAEDSMVVFAATLDKLYG
jgi:hypothetical protein